MNSSAAPEFRGRRSSSSADRYLATPTRLSLTLALVALISCIPPFSPAPADTAPAAKQLRTWSGTKPPISLVGLDGTRHDLSRHAGKLVLVHFFATWCVPCREELASLNGLAAQRSQDLSILAINVAEVPARIRRFLETAPVAFPILLDADRAVTKAWGVEQLPTTYVLDRRLVPRLVVESDLDWTRQDVLAALDRLAGEAGDNPTGQNREIFK